MKILPLRGHASLRALNVFHMLMMGLKMTPSYMAWSYEDFFEMIQKCPPEKQKTFIREAANLVAIEEDELKAVISFACDANGVPYGAANLKNLEPAQLVDIVTEVCFEISQMRIDLVTKSEKKNSENSAST